jgi:hypothetical protein
MGMEFCGDLDGREITSWFTQSVRDWKIGQNIIICCWCGGDFLDPDGAAFVATIHGVGIVVTIAAVFVHICPSILSYMEIKEEQRRLQQTIKIILAVLSMETEHLTLTLSPFRYVFWSRELTFRHKVSGSGTRTMAKLALHLSLTEFSLLLRSFVGNLNVRKSSDHL